MELASRLPSKANFSSHIIKLMAPVVSMEAQVWVFGSPSRWLSSWMATLVCIQRGMAQAQLLHSKRRLKPKYLRQSWTRQVHQATNLNRSILSTACTELTVSTTTLNNVKAKRFMLFRIPWPLKQSIASCNNLNSQKLKELKIRSNLRQSVATQS